MQPRLPFDTRVIGPASADGGAGDGVPNGVTPRQPAVAAPPAPRSGATPTPGANGDIPLEYVRHPRARRYLIRVRLDGRVRVTIPRRGSKREAEAFVAQQRGWIANQLDRVARARERLPEDLPPDQQRALRSRARRELPPRLLELAAAVGLTVSRISIRNQRHRWGSCTTSGHISLNWRLVTMPAWVRDYVLYHELMHLRRMDHSPAFWALVAAVCPRYLEAKAWLRQHAHAPHAAADVTGRGGGPPPGGGEDEDEADLP